MEIGLIVGLLVVAAIFFFLKQGSPKQLDAPPPIASDPPPPIASTPSRGEAKSTSAEERAADDAATEEAVAPELPPPPASKPALTAPQDIQSLRKGLARSRTDDGFFGKLKSLFTGKTEIDASIAEDIEELLLASDVGVPTTEKILEKVRSELSGDALVDPARVWSTLRDIATNILEIDGTAGAFALSAEPTVVLLVGVNGAGKTTTIGKLATKLSAEGHNLVLAAGDTFRAAAVQQLKVWGKRVGCEVVRGKDGADPGSVIFDAVDKAKEIGAAVVLADTAGRLHTKANLMTEMEKIARSADKAMTGAPHEILLVIDATNGQNALAQAKEFQNTLPLTGLVLTKLDGTAKGGVVLGICDELQLPVRFVGLGERPDDLHEFSADAFVEALLGDENAAS